MFFSQFPKVAYDFNRTGTIQQMVNIFRSVRPETVTALNNVTLYKDYKVVDGMRPDVLSQVLYGTPDFYWTFFIINDFLHDGLQVWPMSQEILRQYIEKNYSGKALCFKPEVERDENGIAQGTKNSIAGILELGELVYGSQSGAIGRIVRKDADLNEIIVQDVVEGSIGTSPKTGASDGSIVGGSFRPGEYLTASKTTLDTTTLFSLQINKCYDYSQAPAYYYLTNDNDKRPITNFDGIAPLSLYSDVQWDETVQSQIGNFNLTKFSDVPEPGAINSNAKLGQPIIYSGGYNPIYTVQNVGRATFGSGTISYVTNEQRIRDLNEDRCFIKIIDPSFIFDFVEEFEAILNA